MTDQMVLQAQKWVNATYGSKAGYNKCTEDGSTGWQTIYSLTRALQIELGITSPSDNFGPTTMTKLIAHGDVGITSPNRNIRIIAEAALYCKGYSGGGLDGEFGPQTQLGLILLSEDMGLGRPSVVMVVTPKMFKALLNMDAFVLTSGGSAEIRTCQKWLNATYSNRGQYFIGPCDGHFSRNVQTALVLAIQYELGMTDSQVTGSIGPGTRDGLQASALVSQTTGTPTWIRLFQTAIACNNYRNQWGESGGVFSDDLAAAVKIFQAFCKLEVNGRGDFRTWMSLLVSTGDPNRPGQAIDVMIPLNRTSIATVKGLGYEMVGRYLTGGTNKVLTNSEIALIFDNDMAFFPLYQEFGNKVEYFSNSQGYDAGKAAFAAAKSFGIPSASTIYFSVDFDAIDTEITNYIVPHFRGINQALSENGTDYAIGVYGCRNVCIRLAESGFTSRSFVSGMSAGYSGNLGYPLPDNWAFDQVRNYKVGELELDHDIMSGRDLGVNSVSRPRDPNDGFWTYLIWLEARALQYKEANSTPYSNAELVCQYLRLLDSTNNKVYASFHASDKVFGQFEQGFIDFVKHYDGMPDRLPLRDPAYLWDSDVTHFGATVGAVMTHDLAPSLSVANIGDFGGWGGDLISILGQCHQDGVSAASAYTYATQRLAITGEGTYFDRDDWFADVDAFNIGRQLRLSPGSKLSELLKRDYASKASARQRFANFYDWRFNQNAATAQTAAESMFDEMGGDPGNWGITIRNGFWIEQFGGITSTEPGSVDAGVRTEVARAFKDCLLRFVNS